MLRVGEGYAYLRQKAAKGSKSAQAELDRLVMPQSEFLWQAFADLSRGRGSGMNGPLPIQISEILAWCEFNQVRSEGLRRRVMRAIRGMDRTFLEWVAKNGAS